jgi:hypothetical protein
VNASYNITRSQRAVFKVRWLRNNDDHWPGIQSAAVCRFATKPRIKGLLSLRR